MIRTVYLDQNYWIDLMKEDTGKTHNNEMRKSLDAVLIASQNNTAIFPISLIHLLEASTRDDQKTQEDLLDFMIKISKGYAIIPYTSILEYEIRYAMCKRVNRSIKHPKEFVIGKGIPYLIGAKPQLVPKNNSINTTIPVELEKELIELTYSLKAFVISVKDQDVIKSLKKYRKGEIQLAERIEKTIENDKKFEDIDFRRRYCMLRLFAKMIIPKMAVISSQLGFKKEEIIPPNSTRAFIENFFQSMPSIYTDWALTFRRDVARSKKGKIDAHDSNDIAALSIAIPYCDIVATDKKWQSVCYQEKLGELFDTKILFSINDLYKYIS
jgi:hypothetical protein